MKEEVIKKSEIIVTLKDRTREEIEELADICRNWKTHHTFHTNDVSVEMMNELE